MTILNIPVTGGSENAHQQFDIQLGDNLLTFILDYRTIIEQWSLNILQNDTSLVNGAMLEVGGNIIKNWNLDIGKIFVVGALSPTLNNLGINNKLVWVSDDEILQ